MDDEKKQLLYAIFNDFGQSIKELRIHKALSLEEAAEKAGITPTKLAAIERGRLFDNLNALCKLVESLGGRIAIVPAESADEPHCSFIEFDE